MARSILGDDGQIRKDLDVKYGRLWIVKYIGARGNHRSFFLCVCDCGNLFEVAWSAIQSGGTQSCGCLNMEMCAQRPRTHGLRKSSEYAIWQQILNRCRNSNLRNFSSYGGRGIRVCERWLKFENFYADMGPRPTPQHSIDRIDNDGNYEPDNCRWSTRKEQCRNTRRNRLVTFRGETMCIAELCERLSLENDKVRQRLNRGWSIERIVATPWRCWKSGHGNSRSIDGRTVRWDESESKKCS